MSIEKELIERSNHECELCKNKNNLSVFLIQNSPDNKPNRHLYLCNICIESINDIEKADENHWRMLNDTIWNENNAVQVISWRMLHQLKQFDWTQDLLDMAYLDDETLAWAQASNDHLLKSDIPKHLDCFGAELVKGDNVVLVKTLEVKGATFDAKMGTVVRNIRLVEDNIEQIEGKVNGSQIVILTKYVRKSNPKDN